MNILLTGAAGLLGSHAAVVLAQAGHCVVLRGNLSNSQREVGHRVAQIIVRNMALLAKSLTDHRIDAVMHFAGLKAVGGSSAEPIVYYANNLAGTVSLLQATLKGGGRTPAFSSSATVYGQPNCFPIDEEYTPRASNLHGRSKLHIEEVLADVAYSDPNRQIAPLRYFKPLGTHESGLIGADPRRRPNKLMPYVVQVAAGLSPNLSVFGSDCPAPDRAEKVRKLLRWQARRGLPGTCENTWLWQRNSKKPTT